LFTYFSFSKHALPEIKNKSTIHPVNRSYFKEKLGAIFIVDQNRLDILVPQLNWIEAESHGFGFEVDCLH